MKATSDKKDEEKTRLRIVGEIWEKHFSRKKTIISIFPNDTRERERNAMNRNYFCCASRGGRQNLIPKLVV